MRGARGRRAHSCGALERGPGAGKGFRHDAARTRVQPPLNQQANDSAHSRTDLAEDRTILANERTFAGWMRTSLACVAIGAVFPELFQRIDPPWVARAIATGFLLLAILVIVLAERRSAAVMERLSAHIIVTARPMNMRLFAAAISLGSAALTVAIWAFATN